MGVTTACTPNTSVISVNGLHAPGNGISPNSSISGDGRFIVFASQSRDIVPGGNTAAARPDVFLRDTCGGPNGPLTGCTPKTLRISQAISGTLSDHAGERAFLGFYSIYNIISMLRNMSAIADISLLSAIADFASLSSIADRRSSYAHSYPTRTRRILARSA